MNPSFTTLQSDHSTTETHHSGYTGSSFDFTLGRTFDHFTGLLHIGNHDGQYHLQGALLYHDGHHLGHHYYGHYGVGHYYHHYQPFYTYPYYIPYYPFYGYTYDSVYYSQPVVYRFYNTEVIYVDGEDDRVITIIDTSDVDRRYDSTAMGPPAPSTGTTDASVDYKMIEDPLIGHPVKQGSIAFAQGDYEEAKKLFVQAMLSDERDGYAKLLYSVTSFAVGEYDVASVALRRALMTTDLLIDRPLDVRTLYKDLHRFDTQMDRLKRYVADHPKDRETRFLLGYIHYATGRQEPAVAIFSALMSENQDDALMAKLHKAATLTKPQNIPSSSDDPTKPNHGL